MIAALFVEKGGAYYGLPDVDPWPEERDARKYVGPWPVVAHPPCSRWCRLAGLVEARWGHKRGDDGGAFSSALESVRRYGGVLEHPAYSDAFGAHGLPRPLGVGWQLAMDGGWVAYVEQRHYGHPAKKATWLNQREPAPHPGTQSGGKHPTIAEAEAWVRGTQSGGGEKTLDSLHPSGRAAKVDG